MCFGCWTLLTFRTYLLAAYQAVLVAVQEAHGSHYTVSEGFRDKQAQLHATALHQPTSGYGAPRQPCLGSQLQECCLHSGISPPGEELML